jgi:hypothetical protein
MPSSGGDVREYVAVHGCLRVLTAAVVAVTGCRQRYWPTFRFVRGESARGPGLNVGASLTLARNAHVPTCRR